MTAFIKPDDVKVGDKIEVTEADDRLMQGWVDGIYGIRNGKRVHFKGDPTGIVWRLSDATEIRLLHRPKPTFYVGQVITSVPLNDLPVGTVLNRPRHSGRMSLTGRWVIMYDEQSGKNIAVWTDARTDARHRVHNTLNGEYVIEYMIDNSLDREN